MSFLMDGMAGMLNRQLLRYAIGRALTCPVCDIILDHRDAVLVTLDDQTPQIQCGACFDNCVHELDTRGVNLDSNDVIDGRVGR